MSVAAAMTVIKTTKPSQKATLSVTGSSTTIPPAQRKAFSIENVRTVDILRPKESIRKSILLIQSTQWTGNRPVRLTEVSPTTAQWKVAQRLRAVK